jgi:antitoxin PrlF
MILDCGDLMAALATSLRRASRQSYPVAMKDKSRRPVFSRLSDTNRTVTPREVRELLGVKPGDTLRYRVTEEGVLLDKAPANEADDSFATFSEWGNEADEKAYGSL